MRSLSRAEFERVVREALEELPPEFHRILENVAVVVEDDPDPVQLEELGLEEGDVLLGLYHGVSLLERESGYVGLPDRVVVYRRPILQSCRSRREVAREIKRTVIHELGHHVGLSDDDMVF